MIRNPADTDDAIEFIRRMVRLVALALGLGLLLAIVPVGLWLMLPILAIPIMGYRIVSANNEWTDDIEAYLKAVEDNK